MTQRKRNRATLKRLRRHAVEADFNGGTLTSDGGLILLREVDRRLGLIKRIDSVIPDPRDPVYTTHLQSEMLASRIFAIAAGYEDGNDHQQLRDDPAFQVAAGRTPAEKSNPDDQQPLASPSTLSRLENRISKKTCFQLNELLVDLFLDSFESAPEEIVLDFDATDDTVHGNQEQKHFNRYYNAHCFLPLYVFCGDQPLVAYLRSSKTGAAKHAIGVTKLLVRKIRARWPDAKIILRGDSDFSKERLMRWCDKNNVHYIFGFRQNATLKALMVYDLIHAHADFLKTGEPQRRFTWCSYRAKSWDRHRWVVCKAEHSAKGSNPRFVVTNQIDTTQERIEDLSPSISPQAIYEQQYCPRGEMENRIKEQQHYLFADRTSCTDFTANQFRLLLSTFAYVLVNGLRRHGLSGTPWSNWRVDTIRLRLFKIAARVKVSCRRVVFHLASACPYEAIFNRVRIRLCRSD